MTKVLAIAATVFLGASYPMHAAANTVSFNFNGSGVSGNVVVTYGAATDAKYPEAFEVTGIGGSFSDSNNGLNLVNAPILGLVPINHATPEPANLLAPNDFSRFFVANGTDHGFLSYDNLFWPGGSPQTASDYPFHGGFLDIYGLLFDIGDGKVVNLWSDGGFDGNGPGPLTYGVAVATADTALDYVFMGVDAALPEPSSYALVLAGLGLLGYSARRRKQS
ncbi:PEP-CTERM sorting domain-containing protein [Niveibacterium sp. SC-1]|uniref:PEP-CTERM sorting domain-containing protein n=1 Tax=Niveibacterium sp. SC-1 TaxID=3135646 RepID=UPI0031201465